MIPFHVDRCFEIPGIGNVFPALFAVRDLRIERQAGLKIPLPGPVRVIGVHRDNRDAVVTREFVHRCVGSRLISQFPKGLYQVPEVPAGSSLSGCRHCTSASNCRCSTSDHADWRN